MDELERRIRESLDVRSRDVEPSPATWDRVSSRIRRRRVFAWAGVAAGTATAVTAGAFVLPALFARDSIPPIDSPPTLPVPSVEPTVPPTPPPVPIPAGELADVPPFYVWTDGDDILLSSFETGEAQILFDGHDGIERESSYRAVAVRPGSTPENLTVVASAVGEGMHWFEYVTIVDHGEPAHAVLPAQYQPHQNTDFATGAFPVWSPDGRHLAWIEQTGPQDGLGNAVKAVFGLRIIGWSDGPGTGGNPADDNTMFELQGVDEVLGLTLEDWIWTEGADVETSGFLYLSALVVPGTVSAAEPLAIQRQSDGAIALPDGRFDAFAFSDRSPYPIEYADSHSNDGAAVGPEYVFLAEPTGGSAEEVRVSLRWSGDGDQGGELPLPEEVATAPDTWALWMTARDSGIIVGGVQTNPAWLITRDGYVTVLPGEVVSASFVD